MNGSVFATLADVSLRDAWAHEAHRFTHWLAANLDRLSGVIGIPLELTGTEIRVGTFNADLLARNATDDSVVLIDNQLEGSDYTHLGQIMTYLAGVTGEGARDPSCQAAPRRHQRLVCAQSATSPFRGAGQPRPQA